VCTGGYAYLRIERLLRKGKKIQYIVANEEKWVKRNQPRKSDGAQPWYCYQALNPTHKCPAKFWLDESGDFATYPQGEHNHPLGECGFARVFKDFARCLMKEQMDGKRKTRDVYDELMLTEPETAMQLVSYSSVVRTLERANEEESTGGTPKRENIEEWARTSRYGVTLFMEDKLRYEELMKDTNTTSTTTSMY
jgi:hypothetical protein